MPIALPLPESIAGRPFSVRLARRAGATWAQLRNPHLVAPAHGLRTPSAPTTLAQTTTALALVLPQPWAWSHETAAELLGLPLPRSWRPGLPLSAMRPQSIGRVRRPGLVAHRGLERRATVPVLDMPVIEPCATWRDLAGRLSREDAVAMGDAIAGWPSTSEERLMGLTWLARLEAEVLNSARMPGARRARAALALVREGSRSPMESKARLVFVDAGLPEPELNAEIHDEGRWIAMVDFLWRAARVVVEYQGDHHRTDPQQWRADIRRVRLLDDLGWHVVLMTADDVVDPVQRRAFVARLAHLLG